MNKYLEKVAMRRLSRHMFEETTKNYPPMSETTKRIVQGTAKVQGNFKIRESEDKLPGRGVSDFLGDLKENRDRLKKTLRKNPISVINSHRDERNSALRSAKNTVEILARKSPGPNLAVKGVLAKFMKR
jgi:hypothetical protein